MKNIDEVLSFVLTKLAAIIFEIEQVKDKLKEKTYTIEIKDERGKIIKSITL